MPCPQNIWTSTKFFLGNVKGQGINSVKFFGWLKNFGPAQNILRPVKGQGISTSDPYVQTLSI